MRLVHFPDSRAYKAKRTEIMAAVRSRGNMNTELKLLAIFPRGRNSRLAPSPEFAWVPGFRVRQKSARSFCGRLFLAWLPLALPNAQDSHGLLGT
jgi:hypothetical protein